MGIHSMRNEFSIARPVYHIIAIMKKYMSHRLNSSKVFFRGLYRAWGLGWSRVQGLNSSKEDYLGNYYWDVKGGY